jgi:predicted enzyme related to lactoylglutathione lyase
MKVTEYRPGTPCWVDLASPDIAGSTAFYTALFGWTARTAPDSGGYTIFHKGDDPVAAVGPLPSEGQPPAWTWYAATTDADQTTRLVEAAGGKVLAAPFDVSDQGRMAVYLDSTGTPFSVWQARTFIGARLVNEPDAFSWNELMSRDTEAAIEFYGRVLGWAPKVSQDPETPYVEFQLDGRSVAGMMPMVGDQWPAELPDHWMVYFTVTDVDAAAARIPELGGAVSVPPSDIPGVGRFAVVGDPGGAYFSIITMPG